jgi:recombinational DNA repair protein RecT
LNQIATQPKANEQKLSTWLADPAIQDRLANSLIGSNIDGQAFIAQMVIAMEKPELKACSAASKLKAVHDCATLGLLPTLQQVALIPYKDQLKAMPQWQGYKAIMERHPEILEVEACLVHVSDHYGFSDGEFHHKFDPFGDRQFNSIKDCRGGYVRILYRTGRPPKLHFVPASEIDKAQKCAQTQDVWKKWWYQMALKTLYRNAYARRAVPVDPLAHAALQRLVDHDDAVLGNDPSRVNYGQPPMQGMSRNLRSSQPPAITYDEPLEPASDPEPTKDAAPDTASRDVWQKAIDKAVRTVSEAHLPSNLADIWDECQHPDNPISDEDRAWVASYLESKGLVFEKAGKELFEKGAPQA